MNSVERYEKTRADWLLAHELGWTLSDRRMANELKRRANAKNRSGAGAAESSHHEARIKPIHTRFVNGGEDSKDRMARGLFLLVVAAPAIVLGLGPALAASRLAYRASTGAQLRRGRVPRRRPWLIATAVAAVIGVGVAAASPDLLTVLTLRVWPSMTVHAHWSHAALLYGWLQLTLALALTAWEVRRHGWPGVTLKRASKAPAMPDLPSAPMAPVIPTAAHDPRAEHDEARTDQIETPGPKAPPLSMLLATDEVEEPDDEEPDFDDEELVGDLPAGDSGTAA